MTSSIPVHKANFQEKTLESEKERSALQLPNVAQPVQHEVDRVFRLLVHLIHPKQLCLINIGMKQQSIPR